jgi:hypothetical protein
VHFWPFDGLEIPAGRSAIAEVYPLLWRRGFAPEGRARDQYDPLDIVALARGAPIVIALSVALEAKLFSGRACWRRSKGGFSALPA